MKVLFVGSLPPVKDGISDHNYQLYKHLNILSKNPILLLPNRDYYNNPLNDIDSSLVLSQQDLKSYNFDLIHFQMGNAYPSTYVNYIFNLFKDKNIKKVVTFHDTTNTNLAKIFRTIRSQPSNLLYEFHKPSMRSIIEDADNIIVYSNFLKKRIIEQYGNSSKIKKLYIGAEKLIEYSNNKKNSKEKNIKNVFVIASFGFITPRKGYEDVIMALDLLNRQKIDFKYYLTGKFNFIHYELYLKYLVNKFNLKDKIIFTGYLNNQKTKEILELSDILIQPRKYSNEGASASLASALFTKKPIISSNIGGFSEYIKNDITGLLVNHQAKDYYQAILVLYTSKKNRKIIANAAYKWASENLEWSKIAKEHIEIYSKL